jgi:nucleotide-binding universal stress UspA family protein
LKEKEDNMTRLLIPVTDSPASLATVRAAVARGRGSIDAIDLLSVQPRFSQHIAQWIPKRIRDEWRQESAEKALGPAKRIVDAAGIPCRVHVGVGQASQAIASLARQTGAIEVIETPPGRLERLALPAGIGLGVGAAFLMLADE